MPAQLAHRESSLNGKKKAPARAGGGHIYLHQRACTRGVQDSRLGLQEPVRKRRYLRVVRRGATLRLAGCRVASFFLALRLAFFLPAFFLALRLAFFLPAFFLPAFFLPAFFLAAFFLTFFLAAFFLALRLVAFFLTFSWPFSWRFSSWRPSSWRPSS